MNKGAVFAPLFHRPVAGRLIFGILAQYWMQILFKVAQFWMPFNTLALGGDDAIENVACLCPNHHREIHLGKNADFLTATLKKIRLHSNVV